MKKNLERQTQNDNFIAQLSDQSEVIIPSLQRIVEACGAQFSCSVSVVSILDSERQNFIARFGTDLEGTPLELSFCRHAVKNKAVLLVQDASLDERFRDNPLVLGEPYIRSYLGVPIKEPYGTIVGTICLIDPAPGRFSEDQAEQLQFHASAVEDLFRLHNRHLEARKLSLALNEKNEELTDANRIFQYTEQVAMVGSWEVYVDEDTIFWSDGIYAISDVPKSEYVSLEYAWSFFDPECIPETKAKVQHSIDTGEPLEFDADYKTRKGAVKRVRVKGELVCEDDVHPRRLVGVLQDITDFHQSHIALRRAAERDSLTELYNRYAFDKLLRERIDLARHNEHELWLLLVDLDGFKDVNDTLGHIVGDIVLEDVGRRIARSIPEDSIAARWGGDEFAIVLPAQLTQNQALEIGNELIARISQRTEVGGQYINLGATAGLVQATARVQAKELIRRADTALFYGKRRDPGKVHAYSADIECENAVRQMAINEVRGAIYENRLFAGYQPVVNLATSKVIGFEALMRLHTREGRRLTATEVFPALLDPILSREVSDCMLRMVAQEAKRFDDFCPGYSFISINASEADLISDGFADRFCERMVTDGVDLSRITLEVTETMLLVNNSQPVERVLTELHRNGVSIALDDFGTGYSSLSHLRDFPIDKVKIDGSFVQTLTNNYQSRIIVQALIGMALSMDIEVIAEGVETEGQRAILGQMGCRFGQGFLFGAAQDVSRLSLLALENNSPLAARASAA